MSQVEEFVKIVEGVKDHDVKVVIVTGKPGSGKSKVLREAAEEKKWDYIDCRLLITEKFLEVPPGERQAKAPEMMADILEGYDSEVILLDRLQTLFVPVFHIDVDALLHKLSVYSCRPKTPRQTISKIISTHKKSLELRRFFLRTSAIRSSFPLIVQTKIPGFNARHS